MWTCPKCGEEVEETFEVCWNCGTSKEGVPDPTFERADDADMRRDSSVQIPPGMILATTPSLETHRITKYLTVVAGQAVMGASIFSDFLAGISDIVGGRSTTYESHLEDARQLALAEMARAAANLEANAVVGIHLDYEAIRGTMLMVSCSGTAVIVEAKA